MEDQFDYRRNLFLKEEFSDVEILVEADGSVCRFPCHKLILSSVSKVFATMFNSVLTEGESGRVTVKDVNPDIVLILLEYIYTGHVDFDHWKTCVDVLRVAHKYRIESLIKRCESFLSENLTFRNAPFLLDIAILYDLIVLKFDSLGLCIEGGFIVLKSKTFKHLSEYAVERILSHEDLPVEKEKDVFNAVWEWATLECCRKQKNITEENIFAEFLRFSQYVKFEYMTDAELKSLPKSTFKYVSDNRKKVQTSEEASVVCRSTENDFTPMYIGMCFKEFLISKRFILSASNIISSQNSYLSLLRFSVNADVFLVDFTLTPVHDSKYESYFESLRLCCKDKILIQWPEMKSLKVQKKYLRYISLYENCNVQEYLCEVPGFVLLKSNVDYTVEVKPEYCVNFPLKWPSSNLEHCGKCCQDNVEIFVHSRSSFGIRSMNFLRA